MFPERRAGRLERRIGLKDALSIRGYRRRDIARWPLSVLKLSAMSSGSSCGGSSVTLALEIRREHCGSGRTMR